MNRLLFRGTKTFWKTKSSLNLIIVEYPENNIFEIIAFDPVLQTHAPRIYVDQSVVRSILNKQESSVEGCINIDSAIVTFLFNHILLIEYLPESKSIKIDVRAIFQSDNECIFVVDRPDDLDLCTSSFGEPFSEATAVYQTGRVRQLEIPPGDRLRIPLILARTSKGLPLRESDAKIWACFVHNKTQEQLVESIAVALEAHSPLESRQVLRSAAHAALLPQHCPFPGSRSGTSTPHSQSSRSTTSVSRRGSGSSSRLPSPDHTHTLTHTFPSLSLPEVHQQKSPAKVGLPPLTPSLAFAKKISDSSLSGSTKSCTEAQSSGIAQSTDKIRKVQSFSDILPLRLARSVLYSVSRSTPTSPLRSPRRVVPIDKSDHGDEEDDFVFADLIEDESVYAGLGRTLSATTSTGVYCSAGENSLSEKEYNSPLSLQQQQFSMKEATAVKQQHRRRSSFGDRLTLPDWSKGLFMHSTNTNITTTSTSSSSTAALSTSTTNPTNTTTTTGTKSATITTATTKSVPTAATSSQASIL